MAPTLFTSCNALPPEGVVPPWGGPAVELAPTLFTSCNALPPEGAEETLLDERALSKLKWRCRRGLLENDLFIERFFKRHEARLTVRQAEGLNDLMALSDNDLLDLLLKRKNPDELADSSALSDGSLEVLTMLRVPARPL